MYDPDMPDTPLPSMSYMVAEKWCMAGLSLEAIAQPSCPTCRLGCCQLMMYWPIIPCCRTIPASLRQIKRGRYGKHYGLVVDQASPVCGLRCRMESRGSNTARCVIRQIQHSMGSHTGTVYTRYLYSLCARPIRSRSYLCQSSSQGYLSYFSLVL